MSRWLISSPSTSSFCHSVFLFTLPSFVVVRRLRRRTDGLRGSWTCRRGPGADELAEVKAKRERENQRRFLSDVAAISEWRVGRGERKEDLGLADRLRAERHQAIVTHREKLGVQPRNER